MTKIMIRDNESITYSPRIDEIEIYKFYYDKGNNKADITVRFNTENFNYFIAVANHILTDFPTLQISDLKLYQISHNSYNFTCTVDTNKVPSSYQYVPPYTA